MHWTATFILILFFFALTFVVPSVAARAGMSGRVAARRNGVGAKPKRRRHVRVVALPIALTFTFLLGGLHPSEAASWFPLTNVALGQPGNMILLSDGTVMVQFNASNQWMRLTPDRTGSYRDGTWSRLASMSTPRYAYASNVLRSGKVWLLGGEFTDSLTFASNTNTGEIYDPVSNTWSPIMPHPEKLFGDAPSMLLPNEKILAGSLTTKRSYIYDIKTNSWSFAASKVYDDQSAEESWVKLPGGSVLTYDVYQSFHTGGQYAEKYDPATNTWSSISPSDGTARGFIPQLSSGKLGAELGPLVRVLRNGRIFAIGATGHTALYTPSTNTWAAGPDIVGTLPSGPALFGADDAPAAVLPNGHVLFAADAGPALGIFSPPTQLFDFNPVNNTILSVAPPIPDALLGIQRAFATRMLILPTGQVLFSDGSAQLWIYTPDGPIGPFVRPVITNVTYNGGGVFTLTGRQLNGQSAGSSFGDDAESDENFPIVGFKALIGGNVFYGRTTNWSTTGVATGLSTPETVNFTLHPAMVPGPYTLVVSGAGISSFPVFIFITPAEIVVSCFVTPSGTEICD